MGVAHPVNESPTFGNWATPRRAKRIGLAPRLRTVRRLESKLPTLSKDKVQSFRKLVSERNLPFVIIQVFEVAMVS